MTMISLTVNNAMLELLRQATGLAEVRDENGTVVGFFAPVSVERGHLYAQAAAQTDPKEIARRKEPGRKSHTTNDVLDHLNSLERS
jgi:hypothetical protein